MAPQGVGQSLIWINGSRPHEPHDERIVACRGTGVGQGATQDGVAYASALPLLWHCASFRCRAAIWSFSERSGHYPAGKPD